MNRLKPGEILSLADGSTAVIESLVIQEAKEGEEFTTYNFEVEYFHTYFVLPKGSDESQVDKAVWVHNTGCVGKLAGHVQNALDSGSGELAEINKRLLAYRNHIPGAFDKIEDIPASLLIIPNNTSARSILQSVEKTGSLNALLAGDEFLGAASKTTRGLNVGTSSPKLRQAFRAQSDRAKNGALWDFPNHAEGDVFTQAWRRRERLVARTSNNAPVSDVAILFTDYTTCGICRDGMEKTLELIGVRNLIIVSPRGSGNINRTFSDAVGQNGVNAFDVTMLPRR